MLLLFNRNTVSDFLDGFFSACEIEFVSLTYWISGLLSYLEVLYSCTAFQSQLGYDPSCIHQFQPSRYAFSHRVTITLCNSKGSRYFLTNISFHGSVKTKRGENTYNESTPFAHTSHIFDIYHVQSRLS
jgi:hypothetical protein